MIMADDDEQCQWAMIKGSGSFLNQYIIAFCAGITTDWEFSSQNYTENRIFNCSLTRFVDSLNAFALTFYIERRQHKSRFNIHFKEIVLSLVCVALLIRAYEYVFYFFFSLHPKQSTHNHYHHRHRHHYMFKSLGRFFFFIFLNHLILKPLQPK